MASWRPQTELEEEIVSLQPECNFIYGNLTDAQKKRKNFNHSPPQLHFLDKKSEKNDTYSSGLHTIRAVQKMAGGKPFAEPEIEDLNNCDDLDRETVAMIRNCGMGATIDMPLNEKTTLQTFPVPQDIRIVRNGRKKFPIIYDDNHFKIESTRMRNKKLMETISMDSLTTALNGIQLEQEKHPITVLNEIEVKEPTKAEITAKEYQDFISAYPKLGKNENKVSKNNKSITKESNMKAFKFNNNEILPSSSKRTSWTNKKMDRKFKNSTSPSRETDVDNNLWRSRNSSADSRSVYESFETLNSSSSSTYFSAHESPKCSRKNQTAKNDESYAKVVQSNENSYSTGDRQKRYYTPKEVYDRKRYL